MNPVVSLLLTHYGISSVEELCALDFSRYHTKSHQVAKHVNVKAEFEWGVAEIPSVTPLAHAKRNATRFPLWESTHDMSRVFPTIITLYGKNNTIPQGHFGIRTTYISAVRGDERDQMERAFRAAFGQPEMPSGLFAEVRPGESGSCQDVGLQPLQGELVMQPTFLATLAAVTQDNIRNGCIPIPPAVCEAVGFPDTMHYVHRETGELVETERGLIRSYVAVPRCHLLAYFLDGTPRMLAEYALAAQTMRILPSTPLPSGQGGGGEVMSPPFYFVPDIAFERCVNLVWDFYMHKVKPCSLDDLGLGIVPYTKEPAAAATGSVRVQAIFQYIAIPRDVNPATILPCCDVPGIPSFREIYQLKTATAKRRQLDLEKRKKLDAAMNQ